MEYVAKGVNVVIQLHSIDTEIPIAQCHNAAWANCIAGLLQKEHNEGY
jgi:hypothetical protein